MQPPLALRAGSGVKPNGRRRFERYVAIGDSSTEGLDDPDGHGGYRGWANRLAEQVAAAQGSLLYANLGIRGRTTRRILDEQLAPAVAMRPDLVTLFCGTNDVVRPLFSPAALQRDVERMQRTLIAGGATVLGFTLPEFASVAPLAALIGPRIRALNSALRRAAAATGATLVDFARHPVASDPRLWSADRLHANAVGHARIAAALAHALDLPGFDGSWSDPLPPEGPRTWGGAIAAEVRWGRDWFLPWIWRHLRRRSSGDGRLPKRPSLAPVRIAEAALTSHGAGSSVPS